MMIPTQSFRLRRMRSGFSLIELLVVFVCLTVVMLFGAAILTAVLKVQQAAASAHTHLTQRNMLADEFRTDVHQATMTPDRLNELVASPECLILRRANGDSVTYELKDGYLQRTERAGGTIHQRLPIGPEGTTVEFLRPSNNQGIVTLRLRLMLPQAKAARVHEISAALGGDFR